MADAETEDLPSKRVRLSSVRENGYIDTQTELTNSREATDVDEERNLDSFIAFSGSFLSGFDKSREQNGGPSDFQTSADVESRGCEDFPSCFSVEDDLDDIDEHHFQPIAGPMGWVQRQIDIGISPRDILAYMVPHAHVPPDVAKSTLWKIVIDILTEPTLRQKLPHVNTLDDVVTLIKSCRKIVLLTGAGVSVSCGIPDFRSRDGIYAKLSVEYPDLPDPQAMFDITYFNQNPKPFFKFAKEIFPGQFQPSLGHRFIHQLEKQGHLLRNYSQNIDTLEQIAGITQVIQCHGSFTTASCTKCKFQVPSEEIKDEIFSQTIPLCRHCSVDENDPAIMKPDIVFFGESLPSDFYTHLGEDSHQADLLVVIGSSLKVRPVALIPSHISPEVPQILINREPLRHMTFDVELLGDCDIIVAELCRRLGGPWAELLEGFTAPSSNIPGIPPFLELPPELVSCDPYSGTHITLDEGKSTGHCSPQDTRVLEEMKPMIATEQQTDSNCQQLMKTNENNEEQESTCKVQDNAREKTKEDELETQEEVPSKGNGSLKLDLDQGEGSSELGVGETKVGASTNDLIPDLMSIQSTPEHLSFEDTANFIFLPPSRYIFSGAELCNSPLSSPRADVSHLIPSDDNSDSEDSHVGSGISYGSSGSNMGSGSSAGSNMVSGRSSENKGVHSVPNDPEGGGYSSGDGSEGYGSGVPSGSDLTTNELKLITGGLYSYSCGSEENTAMSVADLLSDESKLHSNYDPLVGSHDLNPDIGEPADNSGPSPDEAALFGEQLQAGPFSSLQQFTNNSELDSSTSYLSKQEDLIYEDSTSLQEGSGTLECDISEQFTEAPILEREDGSQN